MHLPRMTVRRWMIAVAVVGVGLGLWSLGRTSLERASKADAYGQLERLWVRGDLWDSAIPTPEDFARVTAEYRALRLKYRRAARYPWLRVPRDPPDPK